MVSLSAYKIVHILGVLTLFSVVGGIALHAANGGSKQSNTARTLIATLHGVALLLILVGGFGALARLGGGFGGWVWSKLAIWLIIGGLAMLPYKKPHLAKTFLWLMPLLGAVSAFLALYKPF